MAGLLQEEYNGPGGGGTSSFAVQLLSRGGQEYCNQLSQLGPDEQLEYVESLDDLNEFSIALGVFLWLATMLAVVPQHIKMWQVKSSEGLSIYMLFLSNINQFSSIINATILKFPQVRACFEADVITCTPSLLTWYQLAGAWVATFPVFWWYLLFFHRTESFKQNPKEMSRNWKIAFSLFILFIVYVVVMIILSAIFIVVFGECDDVTTWFGWVVGIASIVTVFVQWSPQIYATWRLKAVGSFSILTLAIQAPGTMVVVYFLVFLSNESISTWLSYFAAGLQQFVLLALLVFFWWKNRKAASSSTSTGEDESILGRDGSVSSYTTEDDSHREDSVN